MWYVIHTTDSEVVELKSVEENIKSVTRSEFLPDFREGRYSPYSPSTRPVSVVRRNVPHTRLTSFLSLSNVYVFWRGASIENFHKAHTLLRTVRIPRHSLGRINFVVHVPSNPHLTGKWETLCQKDNRTVDDVLFKFHHEVYYGDSDRSSVNLTNKQYILLNGLEVGR